jgi:hypothetical protein
MSQNQQKKILIMIMSCNDSFFLKEEEIIHKTWLNKIPENIDYCFYRGDETLEKHKYNKEEHLLNLRCEDNIENTFKKTYYAFNIIGKIFKDYDYVFRTNTSTYVNLDLLNNFIQRLDNDEILWTGELYSLSNSFCPYPLYLYGRGNGIILSKKLINIINKEGLGYLYLEKCDDWIIGNILNSYWIRKGKNYLDYIKGYTHGWFRCVPEEQPNNHKLCVYGNKNSSFDFLKQFITIQVKRYRERQLEEAIYYELHRAMENNVDNELDKTTDKIFEYSKSPSVFIGSILGYTDYNEWLNCDKMKLFNYQVKHKASDDEEFGKDTKWL